MARAGALLENLLLLLYIVAVLEISLEGLAPGTCRNECLFLGLSSRAQGEGYGSDCLFLGNRTGSVEGSNCDFPLLGGSEEVPH